MFNFSEALEAFNKMYKLPVADAPTLNVGVPTVQRLRDFKVILQKELNEVDDIINKIAIAEASEIEVLTDIADWLGDIQVYCGSEMKKFGLPQEGVLRIIMESNMSKLGEDGMPIYDANGKVCKGPNYWKPEPEIANLLFNLRKEADLKP